MPLWKKSDKPLYNQAPHELQDKLLKRNKMLPRSIQARSGVLDSALGSMANIVAMFVLLQTLITTAYAAGAGGPDGVTPINQGWLFGGEYTPGSEVPAFDDTKFQEITIPHVVVPLGWNNYDNNAWNKIWIYRRHFDLPKNSPGNSVRTFLDFDGVLTITSPTINGHVLPTHEGGYLPFSYEITDYVKSTGNVLGVVVDARWSYVNPEGSANGPSAVDYLEPGGINRDVALRTVPSSFIYDVFAKPVNVLNSSREVVLEYTIDSAKAPGHIHVLSQLQDGVKFSHRPLNLILSPNPETRLTRSISLPRTSTCGLLILQSSIKL